MKNYPTMRFFVLAFAAITIFAVSCTEDNAVNNPAPVPNIAQIVAQSPNFSTLNAALVRTNLTSSLTSGSLTFFAPDNAAFINSGITDINAVPVSRLDSIIKYSILDRPVNSFAIPTSDTLKSRLGKNIFASRNANGSFVNGIAINQADILASNGIIHRIRNVMVPPTQNIVQIAAGNPNFSFLSQALVRLNLVTLLSGPGKFTVFAPTDAAFIAAGITDVNAVPLATLDAIIKYHVLPSNVFFSDLTNNATFTTLQGGTITISTVASPGARITGSTQPVSTIMLSNLTATNGVIHVLDRVMLP